MMTFRPVDCTNSPPGIAGLRRAAGSVAGRAGGGRRLAWWVVRVLRSEDLQQGAEWRYDVSRINELRRVDPFYRLFQPVIQLLARLNRKVFRDSLPAIQREIQAAGLPRFWLPEEYLAKAATDRPVPDAGVRLPVLRLVRRPGLGRWPLLAVPSTAWLLAAAAGRPGADAAAPDQAPHALPARSADAADGGRLDVHRRDAAGGRRVPRASGGRGVRPRAGRHEPGQDPRRGLPGHARPAGRRRNHQHHRLDPAGREPGHAAGQHLPHPGRRAADQAHAAGRNCSPARRA